MRERLMIGRYLDTGSWLHRLDPRAKITAMLLYLPIIMLTGFTWELAAIAVVSLALMRSSRVPLWRFALALRPLLFILLFILAMHLFFDSGGVRLVSVGPVGVYAGGLERGVLAACRMSLFVMFTALLTFTTPPAQISKALERMTAPLRLLGMSPGRISLMIGISLRFIPAIMEEAEKIVKAQTSRGLSFRDMPLAKKARQLIALLVPVTAGALYRAATLADSMEARGYRLGAPRTAYDALAWESRDTGFIAAFVMLLLAVTVS